MKTRLIGVLLVVALVSVFGQVAALGAPSVQPSVAVIGTLPPAYVGTDYTVDVRVMGLAAPRLVLKQRAAPRAEFEAPVAAANQMALSATGETVASAYIPGSAFKAAGVASFSIRGLSLAGTNLEFGPYSIEVLNPPARRLWGIVSLALWAPSPHIRAGSMMLRGLATC